MSYKINRTDGSLLAEIIDSTLDQVSTDLTLIGKNTSNFGEHINENFVFLLENFASTSAPNRPITGQLWFDTNELRLKVYNGQQWKQGSGPVVSGTAPLVASLTQGDFWIDSAENQLYFYDGQDGLKLAGPIYKQSQGISGFEVRTLRDTDNIERTVLVLWLAGAILGIFSKNTGNFSIPNTTFGTGVVINPIKPGFNVCNLPIGGPNSLKFNVTCSVSDSLSLANNQTVSANSLVRNDGLQNIQGPLNINNNNALRLGSAGQITIGVNTDNELIIGGPVATLTVNDKLKLPTYTTQARDSRTDVETGEIIYNSTTNKVQARTNTQWVDLN